MRTLQTIATSLRAGRVHPTVVLNALIEVENAGGAAALRDLEQSLARLERAMRERGDTGRPMACAWLEATRAYLERHAPVAPLERRPAPASLALAR